jgi:hypothetical protein
MGRPSFVANLTLMKDLLAPVSYKPVASTLVFSPAIRKLPGMRRRLHGLRVAVV